MRIMKKGGSQMAECDMTPMIDMTFQLVAFLMIMVNFTEVDQSERIRLPSSELAKPPEAPPEKPICLQLTRKGRVLFVGDEVTIPGLKPLLQREYKYLNDMKAGSAKKATVIIRADRETETGKVQEVIKACQETGFEKFALRAKQESVSMKAM